MEFSGPPLHPDHSRGRLVALKGIGAWALNVGKVERGR